MTTMTATEVEGQDRVLSLPQLQSLMKKDPEAYEPEFDQQWSHFESMLDIFKMKPQKPQKSFGEQVMFLAHVSPSYEEKGSKLPDLIINVLSEHFQVMHAEMRQVLAQALVLLRNRDQFPCIRALPLYFKLFTLQDKGLRAMLFSHIVRDIAQMHKGSRNQKVTGALRDFFFDRLKEGDTDVARRACGVFISLYRQGVWRDTSIANLASAGLLHPDVKIAAALAHMFLGNQTKGLEGILEESGGESSDDGVAVEGEIKGVLGSKKTANRQKRIKRAQKNAKKAQGKRLDKLASEGGVSFVAIDLLHDPQSLAERLLQRVAKGSEPYLFRILMLHLIARLVARHSLQLLNIYPFLTKYLQPAQREVTKILACLVEATHPQVPPEELRPAVLHVMRTFVCESQAPEVIEVGLNAIREICSRAVNILTEDELTDLTGFLKFKNKGVGMAARSLINTYRELHPHLLHRSLRGREATMALSRGELQAPQYGEGRPGEEGLEAGLELLSRHRQQKLEGEGLAAGDAIKASEQVLSADDFKKLRKLQLQRSIQLQMGSKRKHEEITLTSSDSDEDGSSSESSNGEQGLAGRLPDAICGEELKGRKKKGRTKADRVASAESGRTDWTERLAAMRAKRKGGKTNKEHNRAKPHMMILHSKAAKKKKTRNAHQKVTDLKKHIKTLKKKVGGTQKRRRA